MAIDERSRHALYLRLEAVLGPDQATTLMEHLPPVGWAEVATTRDIEALATRIDGLGGRIDGLETTLRAEWRADLATLESRLLEQMLVQTRTMVFSMLGMTTTVAALAFAAARLG